MRIPILYAGNRRVFDGMLISLLSVVKYCTEPLDVYLLTMDLSDRNPAFLPITEDQRAYLETLCRERNPKSSVTLLDAGGFYRKTMMDSPNAETGYTPYCFLRLYADRFFEIPDKAIYLDTDTVLCDDISKLYDIDIDGYELAGVRDRYGRWFFGFGYINSGVLLLNLAELRRTGAFHRVLDACARKKIFLPDQTAINRCVKRKKHLPRRFNEQKRAEDNTVIRHFSMSIIWFPRFRTQNIKPWQVEQIHDVLKDHRHDEILNEYLRRKAMLHATKRKELL